MATVTATLQVNFTEGAGEDGRGALRLEIDGREDGLNGGDTSFRPGDEAFYLMYKAGVQLVQHFATAGSISGAGSGARVLAGEDAVYLTFSGSKEASLSYPSTGLSSWEWLGSVYDSDGGSIPGPTPVLVDDGTTIRLDTKVVGILKIEYNSPYDAFRLSGVPLDLDRSLIFAQASTL